MPISRTTSSSVSTVVVGQPVQALGGHAVGAAQVAAVGQRDPQVGGHPAVAVVERARRHPHESSAQVAPVRPADPYGRWSRLDAGALAREVPARAGAGSSSRSSSCCWPTARWWLGQWQFHRLADRKASNAHHRSATRPRRRRPSTTCSPRAAGRRATTSGGVVTATGTYDAERHRRSCATAPATAPPASTWSSRCVTGAGTALLVDRGWMATDNVGGATARRRPGPADRAR